MNKNSSHSRAIIFLGGLAVLAVVLGAAFWYWYTFFQQAPPVVTSGEIVYAVGQQTDEGTELHAEVRATDGTTRTLTTSGFVTGIAADGSMVLYVDKVEGTDTMRIFALEATGSRELISADVLPGTLFDATFSPDGQRILVSVDNGERYDLWVVSRDGSSAEVVTINGEYADVLEAFNGNFAPDGKSIVFVGGIRGVGISAWTLDLSDPAAEPVMLVPFGLIQPGTASFSPDGTKILLQVSAMGRYYVMVMDASGGEPLGLTDDGKSGGPSWTADGRVVFHRYANENLDLYVMNADGTGEEQLTDTPHINEGFPFVVK